MPKPGEHKTVQSRILKYVQEIGWSFVPRAEAETRRGFNAEGVSPAERAAKASLYFDDLLQPAKTAVDKDSAWGKIGLGSFGDTAQWDDVKLYGQKVKPPVE